MKTRDVQLKGTFFNCRLLPEDGLPVILIWGRSNVGKSSLINKLLNRKNLARTSSTPGKTLSINYFLVDRRFYLVDLPGYGYAKVPKTEVLRVRELLTGFFERVRQVRLAVLLIDSRRGFLETDAETVRQLLEKKYPILTILTKSDKRSFRELQDRIKDFRTKFGLSVIPFSIQSHLDQDEVWKYIDQAL